MSYFSQNLKEGEEVVVILRKHVFTFLWPLAKSLIIIAIPLILSPWLFANIVGFYVFVIWLAVGIVYGLYQWFVWFFDSYIITNQRIIDIEQKSLFNRTVSEANLGKVQDVTYEIDGFMATTLNYGTVKVQTAGAAQTIDLNQVARPQEVQDLIVDLQKAAEPVEEEPERELSAKELVKFIARVKDGEEDEGEKDEEGEKEADSDESDEKDANDEGRRDEGEQRSAKKISDIRPRGEK